MSEHVSGTFTASQATALALVSTLAWLSIAAVPYEVATLVNDYGAGASPAAWTASAELLALAFTVTWVGRTIVARDKRRAAVAGVIVAILATLISILTRNLAMLIAARMAVGVGLGLIATATNALPALHHMPARMYAYMQLALAAVFGALMYSTPAVDELAGGRGLFVVELTLLVALGWLAFLLPRGVGAGSSDAASASETLPGGSVRVLAGLTLMFLAQTAIWTFAQRAGEAIGITTPQLALIFTMSALFTVVGAVTSTALGMRLGYRSPLVIGYVVQFAVAIGMYCHVTTHSYIASAIVVNATSTFTTPYVMGLLAELDGSGRSGALGGAAINFGGAAGPAVGAPLAIFIGLAPFGTAVVAVLAVSLGLVIAGERVRAGRSAVRVPQARVNTF